ncbi:hypothetical protein Pfo_011339 [Paulownia fortunei]|nr:hypothetical protein Pfo_011339 [Paulownia fortunei]
MSERLKNFDKNPLSTCKRRIGFEYEDGTSEKRYKKRTQIMNFSHPGSILPETFKNHILNTVGCLESVFLVIEKGLYKTDVSKSQGRLSVPYSQKGEILATLVQPCLEECPISLKNWKSNSMYALVGGWNEVCSRNALRQGMIIQLWSFRRNSALCFALVQIN